MQPQSQGWQSQLLTTRAAKTPNKNIPPPQTNWWFVRLCFSFYKWVGIFRFPVSLCVEERMHPPPPKKKIEAPATEVLQNPCFFCRSGNPWLDFIPVLLGSLVVPLTVSNLNEESLQTKWPYPTARWQAFPTGHLRKFIRHSPNQFSYMDMSNCLEHHKHQHLKHGKNSNQKPSFSGVLHFSFKKITQH